MSAAANDVRDASISIIFLALCVLNSMEEQFACFECADNPFLFNNSSIYKLIAAWKNSSASDTLEASQFVNTHYHMSFVSFAYFQ